MDGRGVLDDAFFLGVAVEADGGCTAGGRRWRGLAVVFEVTGEAFDVDAVDVAEALVVLPAQAVNWRRSSACASRVNPRQPAKNPSNVLCSTSVSIGGWYRSTAVVVSVWGLMECRV